MSLNIAGLLLGVINIGLIIHLKKDNDKLKDELNDIRKCNHGQYDRLIKLTDMLSPILVKEYEDTIKDYLRMGERDTDRDFKINLRSSGRPWGLETFDELTVHPMGAKLSRIIHEVNEVKRRKTMYERLEK